MEQHADGAGVGAGHGGFARGDGGKQRLRLGQLSGHGRVGSSDARWAGDELRRAAVFGQLRVDQYVLEHGNHHGGRQRDVMVARVWRGGHVLVPSSGRELVGSERMDVRASEPVRADGRVGHGGPGTRPGHGSLQRPGGIWRHGTRRAALRRMGVPVVMHGFRELERHRSERGVPADRDVSVFGRVLLMWCRGVVHDPYVLRRRGRPWVSLESHGRREWCRGTFGAAESHCGDGHERWQRQPHLAGAGGLKWIVDRPLRAAALRERRGDLRRVVLCRSGGHVHRRRMWRVGAVHLRSSRRHRGRPR